MFGIDYKTQCFLRAIVTIAAGLLFALPIGYSSMKWNLMLFNDITGTLITSSYTDVISPKTFIFNLGNGLLGVFGKGSARKPFCYFSPIHSYPNLIWSSVQHSKRNSGH